MKSKVQKSTLLLKKYLRTKYGINFSVTSDFYAGGSSLRVKWTLGVDQKTIENEVNRLQEGNFDGMEDMYNYKKGAEVGLKIDGQEIQTYKYVFCSQDIPTELWYKLAKLISDNNRFEGVPPLEDVSQLYQNFPRMFGAAWTWQQLTHQHFKKRNFITDDLSKIELIKVEDDPNENWNYIFTYLYEGKEYKTNVFEPKKPEVEKEKVINLNGVQMVDYSEKAIAVIGDTYQIKDQLKELGGRYNKFLKINGSTINGWIFPKSRQSDVSDLLIQYAKL